jgi:S-DNA-T family DNA segregation ATPase FtsK/SpoIIIE
MSDTLHRTAADDSADVVGLSKHLRPRPVDPDADTVVLDLPEDLDGDRPFIPRWVTSKDGRRAARRRTTRRARRAVRRWAGRQHTERGHTAQVARGARRTHEWVIGFHGVNVQAAAHPAHTATREARQAARRARYTVLPKQRQAAQQHADRAQTIAMTAVQVHKKAKQKVRRGRLLRAAVAYGTPLAVDGVAWLEGGWLGLTGGIVATLGATAWAGSHPLAEERWDPERRSLGDGDPLTEAMLDRAFTAAKVIGEGQQLRLLTPVVGDGEDAWTD